jgi:hypothetical protein
MLLRMLGVLLLIVLIPLWVAFWCHSFVEVITGYPRYMGFETWAKAAEQTRGDKTIRDNSIDRSMNIISLHSQLSERLNTATDYSHFYHMAQDLSVFGDLMPIRRERIGTYNLTTFIHLYKFNDLDTDADAETYVVFSIFTGSCDGCIDSDADDEGERANDALKGALSKASIHNSLANAEQEFLRLSIQINGEL